MINCLPDIERVLIVCPKSLKRNWYLELRQWLVRPLAIGIQEPGAPWEGDEKEIVICNFDILSRYEEARETPWDMRIVDEAHNCFPSGTMVETEAGVVAIESVKRGDRVLSCCLGSGEIQWRKVRKTFKAKLTNRILRIHHENGWVDCTEDHELFGGRGTIEGYFEARNLQAGDYLYRVRQDLPEAEARKINGKVLHKVLRSDKRRKASGSEAEDKPSGKEATNRKGMRMVSQNVPVSFERNQTQRKSEVLQNRMCIELELRTAWHVGKVQGGNQKGSHQNNRIKKAGRLVQDGTQQPDEESSELGENEKGIIRENVSGTRRKRETNGTTEAASLGNRMGNGSGDRHSTSQWQVPKPSELLQGGHREPRPKDCNRSGWEKPLKQEVEVPRSPKNRNLERSRVVRVEVLKQTCDGKSGSGLSRDQSVYCLEVCGNHNFFADGILVSNCSNPSAQRTKTTLGINARMKLHLTGTAAENGKHRELWTLISDLDPERWDPKKGWWSFGNRYCGPRKIKVKVWNPKTNRKEERQITTFDGSTNAKELQEILRSTIMVRRRKEDVLKELPEVQQQIIELPSDGVAGLLKLDNPDGFEAHADAMADGQAPKFEEMSAKRLELGLAKVPFVIEFIDEVLAEDPLRKVIVFGHHESVMFALKAHWPKAAMIIGSTPGYKRQAEVDRFQTDPSCRVILGNDAMKEGLNLQAAEQVIFVEGSWVPGNLAQKIARAARMGQTKSVLVTHLVWEGSLDSRMIRRTVKKMGNISRVLDAK